MYRLGTISNIQLPGGKGGWAYWRSFTLQRWTNACVTNHRMVKAGTKKVHTIKFIAQYSINVIQYCVIKAANNV